MTPGAAIVDDDILGRLGPGGLTDVVGCLHAGDCQSCGRPFAGTRPALAVSSLDETLITASLHHPDCRSSAWNSSRVVQTNSADFLTVASRSTSLALIAGGVRTPTAILLVNPGLEMVLVERHDTGWRVRPGEHVTGAGLRASSDTLIVDKAVPGLSAAVQPDRLSVTLTAAGQRFSAPAHPQVVAHARARAGLLLVVSHAVDPRTVRSATELQPAFTGSASVLGWAGQG